MAVVYPSLIEVIQTDTFEEWRIKTNLMIGHAEAAAANIGNLSFLHTDAATTIVDAINEVNAHADINTANIGDMNAIHLPIKESTIVKTINKSYDTLVTYIDTSITNEKNERMAADAELQSELDITQAAVGLEVTGSFLPFSATSYLTTATTIADSIQKLDIEAKRLDDRQRRTAFALGDEDDNGYLTFPAGTNYIGNHYTDELGNASAKVRHSLEVLDNQVRLNADEIGKNDNTIDNMQDEIVALMNSVGTNGSGHYITDTRNTYAVWYTVRENISIIDDHLDLLYVAVENTLPTAIQNADNRITSEHNYFQALNGDMTALNPAIYSTNVVGSLNALYALLKPLLDGDDSTKFVRRAGDIMSGDLEVRGAISATTSNGNITSTGDISAFV
jgi:hypothetical protein